MDSASPARMHERKMKALMILYAGSDTEPQCKIPQGRVCQGLKLLASLFGFRTFLWASYQILFSPEGKEESRSVTMTEIIYFSLL